jgi:uncharacterized protein (DUF2252 family)
MRDPVVEFMNFNRPFARRNPELLRLKIARMAEGPLPFFRGSYHLFARDFGDRSCEVLPLLSTEGAALDLVGDIHCDNFGTYRASDDEVHYDINDFDETTRGRFTVDVARLATSLLLAAQERGADFADAVEVAVAFLTSYAEAARHFIKKGKDLDYGVSESAPSGCSAIDDLVRQSAAAKRSEFIGRITETNGGHRRLLRSQHYFNLSDPEREQALRLLADYRRRMKDSPSADYYQPEDVCGRVAGIGSMGRLRYAVLIAGKGSKEGRNVLLEFKESRPSAYDLCRGSAPANGSTTRAERVIAVQRQLQSASGPLLSFAVDGDVSFQVREIGPSDNKLERPALKKNGQLEEVAEVQGRLLAVAHARAVAQAIGPTNPLAELEDADTFCQRVLAFALAYADLTRRDWKRFVGQRDQLEDVSPWAQSK